ncbi:MAG: hypothetical protein Q4E75_02980, partial [bacterium]|nr:hypothetical protein [bacterium]
EFYYNEVIDNYKIEYIDTLDEDNFKEIYNLFKINNFYFIEDIILNYLEIFNMDYEDVKTKLENLKKTLGDNFVYIIGNNMKYLNYILE